jgi:hypothetical protein
MLKASQQPGQPEENSCEGSVRDPLGNGARGDSRVAGSVSRLASRHRAAILNGIIINGNLKVLKINYLVRKVDVLFNFP